MRVLAQVKSGDEQFWKQKFHAANGKAGLRGGERRIFFIFPLFPKCSFQILNGFPSGFQQASQVLNALSQVCSQQHLALIPYVLPKVLPFSPIQLGQRVRRFIFMQKLLFWGASIVSTLFFCVFLGWAHFSNWLVEKKKGVGLVKHPQILYINSLGLSVCLSELVHFDSLTVSVRPILQPLDDINDVPKGCRDVK